MKKFWIILAILAVTAVGVTFFMMQPMTPQSAEQVALSPMILASEVEKILTERSLLIEQLFQNTIIVEAVRASNQANGSLDMKAISKLDASWRAAKDGDEFVNRFLTNAVAQVLKDFQRQVPEFIEIFVADAYGLNVGQTNKTSDYYQADEAWWVDSFAKGVGKSYHGEIEFDASSQAEAISIYVPIRDGAGVIGVGKAVLDLNTLKEQL